MKWQGREVLLNWKGESLPGGKIAEAEKDKDAQISSWVPSSLSTKTAQRENQGARLPNSGDISENAER